MKYYSDIIDYKNGKLIFSNGFTLLFNDSTEKSIEELHDVLEEFNSDNPQKSFVIISFIASIFWPIFVPYMILKNILK
jgi:hypothetical protein